MVTVPAQSLLAPVLAWVMAAARVMPAVCGVFRSSALLGITWTPCSRQSLPACCVIVSLLSWLCRVHQKVIMGYNYFLKAILTPQAAPFGHRVYLIHTASRYVPRTRLALRLECDRGKEHGRSTTPVRVL